MGFELAMKQLVIFSVTLIAGAAALMILGPAAWPFILGGAVTVVGGAALTDYYKAKQTAHYKRLSDNINLARSGASQTTRGPGLEKQAAPGFNRAAPEALVTTPTAAAASAALPAKTNQKISR